MTHRAVTRFRDFYGPPTGLHLSQIAPRPPFQLLVTAPYTPLPPPFDDIPGLAQWLPGKTIPRVLQSLAGHGSRLPWTLVCLIPRVPPSCPLIGWSSFPQKGHP